MSESSMASCLGKYRGSYLGSVGVDECRQQQPTPEDLVKLKQKAEARDRQLCKEARARSVVAIAEKLLIANVGAPEQCLEFAKDFAERANAFFEDSTKEEE